MDNEKTIDELTPTELEDARRLADDFLLNYPRPLRYTALQRLYQRSPAAFQIVMKRELLNEVKGNV